MAKLYNVLLLSALSARIVLGAPGEPTQEELEGLGYAQRVKRKESVTPSAIAHALAATYCPGGDDERRAQALAKLPEALVQASSVLTCAQLGIRGQGGSNKSGKSE